MLNLEKSSQDYDECLGEFVIRLGVYFNQKNLPIYSDIIELVYNLEDGNFEYLEENLNSIHIKVEESQNLKEKIFKLLDYIRLENARLTYLNDATKKSIDILNENESSIKKIDKKLIETEEKIEKLIGKQKKSFDSIVTQIITILGIFSTIVITFFGGVTAMSGMMKNMHNVSKFRLVFVFEIIGFIMFNTIFMLLHFIAKLSERSISSSCGNCKNRNIATKKCTEKNNFKCLVTKYPLVFYFNLIISISVGLTVILYYLNYWGYIKTIE